MTSITTASPAGDDQLSRPWTLPPTLLDMAMLAEACAIAGIFTKVPPVGRNSSAMARTGGNAPEFALTMEPMRQPDEWVPDDTDDNDPDGGADELDDDLETDSESNSESDLDDADEDSADLDDEFPLGDGVAERDSVVSCPYCGESVEITLDPGSGTHQQYIEDCAVCCRPWNVTVEYQDDGSVDVFVDASDDQ